MLGFLAVSVVIAAITLSLRIFLII
jgi:hypothetical protein